MRSILAVLMASLTTLAATAGLLVSEAHALSGAPYSWGSDASGQLGNGGSSSNLSVPATTNLMNGAVLAAIATGGNHSLLLGSDGRVYAHGSDAHGQLGDGGSNADQAAPVPVSLQNLPTGVTVTAIAAGGSHSLLLCSNGTVYAFGSDASGQVGDGGANSDQSLPVPLNLANLPAGVSVTAIAAGGNHSLLLCSNGTVYAFGRDALGQLGDGGTSTDQSMPVAVNLTNLPAGVSVTAIAAGGNHSLLRGSNGRAYACGSDASGQLGDGGTNSDQSMPVAVDLTSLPTGLSVTAIAAGGSHSLLRGSNGKAYSFGSDAFGQLGDGGTNANQPVPVPMLVTILPTGVSVGATAAGESHSLLLGSDGKVYACGSDAYGQIGDGGTNTNQGQPVAVDLSSLPTGASVAAIASGGRHSLMLSTIGDGRTSAFGVDASGQLGDGGTNTNMITPVPVDLTVLPSGTSVTAIAAGGSHSLQLVSDGRVYACGSDASGQLGDSGTNTNKSTLSAVYNLNLPTGVAVTAIAAGGSHSLLLASDGKGYSFGSDASGQLGDGGTNTNKTAPVALDLSVLFTGTSVSAIAAGGNHSLLLASDGRVYACGSDASGQLGDSGTNTNKSTLSAVYNLNLPTGVAVTAIAAGGNHSLMLGSNGRVYSFGSDASGQLGDGGTNTNMPAPVAVDLSVLPSGTSVTAIAAGGSHSLILASDGRVYAFGSDASGQLGNGGANINSNTPSAVSYLSLPTGVTVTAIAASANSSYALSNDGRLWAWGANASGQLGLGDLLERSVPSEVVGILGRHYTAISAGAMGAHALALTARATITIASFSPATGDVGTLVTVQGTNLTGVTQVTFNGVPATFSVDSDTQLSATVPVGATTGPISAQNSIGTAISDLAFGLPLLSVPDPSALVFTLDGVLPNPMRGGPLRVMFTLPTRGAAQIELVDLSGRRVMSREMGSLAAGRHVLDLPEGRALAPGQYWLRLSQGSRRAAMRVTVLE